MLAQDAKPEPKTEAVHVVQPGETLGGIAARAEVPRVLIIEANGLKAPYALKAGQKLIIPRRRSHTVKDGETGFDVAMTYGVPWSAIAAANAIKPDAKLKAGQKLAIPTVSAKAVSAVPVPSISTEPDAGLPDTAAPGFAWPVQGKVRRAFMAAKQGQTGHDGIDILAPSGTAVRASAAGKVIFAGPGPDEYGLTVIIWHAGRWTTTYSYLDKITVKVGDKVRAGERVGLVGQTGLAEVPQLHFEVRRNKLAQDPARYLPGPKPKR
ncbi:M23 family metallopeptidase [Novosphingobium sp.]|uniref:M23 family metallopeptidase n=1 Tax=Novosphingobium sp. TaxID=1874826 RepID=UPI00286CDA64|nr:M23 family metallopeptidase [Novosphingobium sp.]